MRALIDRLLHRASCAPVRAALVGLAVTALVGGTLYGVVEEGNVWDGIYWTWVVMPTTGFGDFSPATVPGRWLYVVVVAVGVICVSILQGAITATLTERRLRDHMDTPELDDDLDALANDLRSVIERMEALKPMLQDPRVVEALRAIHEGGRAR